MADKPYGIFGPQPQQPGEEPANLSAFGLGIGTAAASGFLPYKGGRLWDKYIAGARVIETAFPAAILRTFRISEFLSPLESYRKVGLGPTQLEQGGKYSQYLKSIFGSDIEQLTLERKGSVFGTITGNGNKAIGEGLQIIAGTQKGSTIADYYARLYGNQLNLEGVAGATVTDSLNDDLLRVKYKQQNIQVPFNDWVTSLEPHKRQKRLILGAKYRDSIKFAGKDFLLSSEMQKKVAKAEVTVNLFRAKAASTAGRLNTLLRAPLELPVIGEAVSKIPFLKSLPVKPGSASQMFKGYIGKGLAVSAAFKGMEYVDYLRAEGNQAEAAMATTFGGGALGAFVGKKVGQRLSPKGFVIGAALGLAAGFAPRFDEGVIPGVATLYADAQINRAQMSENIGLSDSLREHENIAPGMSSLKTALGFAGVGALTIGLGDYTHFLGSSVMKAQDDLPLWSTLEKTREFRKERIHKKIWDSKLGEKVFDTKIGKSLAKVKGSMAIGAVGGLAVWAGINAVTGLLSGNLMAAIPGSGFLGTTETPEELSDVYSGKEEIAVRKGRWWEFGRSTDYEGGRIEYFRQHNVARLKSRAYQKGIYGSEEERWEHDPIMNPLKALFGSDEWKYHYENKYAKSRPAPLTSTYGEDIPFIGPLIAATIGKIIKPRKVVRPEEWDMGGGKYVPEPDLREEEKPAYELGGIGPGAPVSPDEVSQLFNKLTYRRREAVGLIGFAEGAIHNAITGREEVLDNLDTMATMGKETGSEYWLWKHLNLGGGLGSTEAVRRFRPRTPSYLDTYNPLKNDQPSWMPNDYFIDLKHGNPLEKIKEGEIRLAGSGYAALNPEVKDMDPENYPLIHRLKILGDVAMWSPEYKKTLLQASNTNLSDEHQNMLSTIVDQVKQKKVRREFSRYRFDEDTLKAQDVTVTEVIRPSVIKTKEFGDMEIELQGVGAIKDRQGASEFAQDVLGGKPLRLHTPIMDARSYTADGRMKAVAMFDDVDYGSILAAEGYASSRPLEEEFEQLGFSGLERTAGRFAETAMHGADTPFEMLTPMSPASKLIRKRSPIEEYAKTESVGTGNAFWDRPIENFLSPALNSMKYEMGITDIPESVQERRNILEHFDMLKWMKGQKLQNQRMKSNTIFGTDLFEKSPIRVLPKTDRDFFNEFANARTEDERSQILNLIPENQQRIYVSQWMKQEENVAYAKTAAGTANDYDNQVLVATKAFRKSEGFSISEDLEKQWMQETNGEIPYDEWIRQKKAEEYFATHSLPGADWLGWCLPANQIVITLNSNKKAENIKEGDLLMTSNGYNKVLNIFRRKVNEEIISLTVYHNKLDKMKATRNHKILAIDGIECKYNNSKIKLLCTNRSCSFKRCEKCSKPYISYNAKWIKIEDVNKNMFLPIPLIKSSITNLKIDIAEILNDSDNLEVKETIITNRKGPKGFIPRCLEIDDDFAWLAGYFLADGHIFLTKNRYRGIGFTANLNESFFIKKAKNIIKDKFNLSGTIFERKRDEGDSLNLLVLNKILSIVFYKMFGKNCDGKYKPEWLELITYSAQKQLLQGLLDGDGSKDGRNTLSLANEGLIRMAKQLFEKQGIPVFIRKLTRNNRKDQWLIRPISRVNCLVLDNFIAYRIKDINIEQYKGKVYDFEVEDLHMYSTQIGIYHNSPSVDLEDVKMQSVNMEGLDYHDFGLWDSREEALSQKPYINEELIQEMGEFSDIDEIANGERRANSLAKLSRHSNVQSYGIAGLQENQYKVEIKDGRSKLVEDAYAKLGV